MAKDTGKKTIQRIISPKRVGLGLLVAVLLGMSGVLTWWAGETAVLRLDAEMRKQLFNRVDGITRGINPASTRLLSFTVEDKGTPAFEYLRMQMMNAEKNYAPRGIYSIALRGDQVVFGPGSYSESDPGARIPGTVYREPPAGYRQVLQSGKPLVIGPYNDEFGGFVSALMPVFDPSNGRVLMAVGMDISVSDWNARLRTKQYFTYMTMLVALLMAGAIIVGICLLRYRLRPDVFMLKRLVLIPTALIICSAFFLYVTYANQKNISQSRQVMQRITARAQTMWYQALASKTELLRAQIDAIAENPEMLAAFKNRDFTVLSRLADPVFQNLRLNYNITHFYFITPERTVFLRAHQPERREDLIERTTLLNAQDMCQDSVGLELGPLGAFTLRYVRPVMESGALKGYVELGMEVEQLAENLARDMNLDFIFAIRKAHTSQKNFEAGRALFGFDGQWDAYPAFVVSQTSVASMPGEVRDVLSRDDIGPGFTVFKARQGETDFACGMIPIADVRGRFSAELIIMRNVTAEVRMNRNSFYQLIGIIAILLAALLIVLWLITDSGEKQLREAFDRVRESERLFRSLFDNSLSGVAIHEIILNETGQPIDFVSLQVNRSFELLTDSTAEQVIGKRATEVFPFVKDSGLIDIYGRVALTGESVRFEKFIEPLQRFFNINALQLEQGRFAVVFHDITERKQAAEKIRFSEARLQSLVNIFQYNAASIQELLDFALDEVIKLTASRYGYIYLYHEDHREFVLNTWSQGVMRDCEIREQHSVYALDKAGLWGEAVRQRKPIMVNDYQAGNPLKKGYPDGHVLLNKFLTVPVIHNGRIVAVVGVANKNSDYNEGDILQVSLTMDSVWKTVERKQAEQALQENEQLLRSVLDTASDAIMAVDGSGKIVSWNRAAERIYGYCAAEAIGLDFTMIVPERFRASHYQGFRAVLEQGVGGSHFFSSQGLGVKKDGTEFISETTSQLVEQGQDTLITIVVHDITERLNYENALQNELDERRKAEIRLLDAEALLSEAQQVAHLGTGIINIEAGSFEWSDEIYHILGVSADTPLTFADFGQMVHPDDRGSFFDNWSTLSKDCPMIEIEYRIIRPDGEVRFVQQYVAYRFHEHELGGVFATLLMDITDRKRAELALECELVERSRIEDELVANRDLLTEAQQIAHIGMWIFDMQSQQFSWSDEAYRILGLEVQTPLDYGTFSTMVHPDDYGALAQRWNNMESDSSSSENEYRIIRPDGEVRYIHEYVIYKSGSEHAAALMQDVTERTLAEQRLRQLSQAVEQNPALIVITDPNGNIEYVNPRFVELTGYSVEEVLGKNPRILKSGEMSTEAYEELWRTITSGKEWQGSFHNKKKNGDLYWEGATIAPIRDDHGVITHFLAIKTDITERKRAEEELLQANKDLEEAIAKSNEMALTAELANMTKSEFLANMSHEIRTPMNGVIGMTGLLLDSELTDEQRQYAHIVRSCGESLLALINDILDLSKIESGKLELEELDFDLRTTMEDTAELLSVKAYEKGLEIVCMVDADVPVLLRGDPGRLRQIFMNIAGNAIKFTERGSITLRAMREDEEEDRVTVRFTVADTGIGIPLDKQQTIFTPFTQADGSTTRKYGGTGLGLSISKRLLECMGGSIGVDSQPGQGATFWFVASFEKQPPGAIAEPPVLGDLTGVRVLVLDDHATNRLLVTTLLNGWGCRFAEAADPVTALERLHGAVAQNDPYSIALLDMQMPDMSGDELGRRIKQSSDIAATHLIMMTSLGQRGDAALIRSAGFEGYLNKPLRQALLRECMAMVLGRAQASQANEDRTIVTRHTITEARKQRLRILIAEDNATNQVVALKILEKFGYRADAVADGLEALAALESIPYDLVLMDCQMPHMDGFEATTSIRSSSKVLNNQVPIVAMTAHAMAGDREKCIEAGMDDYLSKPIEPDDIAAVLMRWLGDASELDAPLAAEVQVEDSVSQASVGPVVFDRADFQNRLMGDEDVMKIVIEKFLSDIPGQIELLAAALSEGNNDSVWQLGHKIRGAAANIGAEALRAAAFNIEQAGKAGDSELLRRLCPDLERVMDELHAALVHEGLAE